jgi:hypothetical protein
VSKALLAVLVPTVFVFKIVPLEWLGGAVVLVGMAVALWPRQAHRRVADNGL